MSLCGRFIVPYFYLITYFYSSQNKSNYPSVMLHYGTAVHATLSHCVLFVNLTLPSSKALSPLYGSVPGPQWVLAKSIRTQAKLLQVALRIEVGRGLEEKGVSRSHP